MTEIDFEKLQPQMLNAIGEAVIATDMLGHIQYWNRAAEMLYQWRAEEVIEKNIVEVTPSSTTREQAEEIMRELKEGKTWMGEFDVQRKDGTSFPALVSDSPIYDESGELVGIIGVSRDITERKKLVEKLEERNLYIESISENLPIGFAVNTIDDGDVKYINEQFENIYGWSREVLTNVSVFFEKVFPDPDYREEMSTKIVADIQSGDPERMRWEDLKIVTSTGEERYVYAYNIPLPEQNLMISTVQNVTERKLAEDQLKTLNAILDERAKNNYKKFDTVMGSVAQREVRMAELKEVIRELTKQLEEAGVSPKVSDPYV